MSVFAIETQLIGSNVDHLDDSLFASALVDGGVDHRSSAAFLLGDHSYSSTRPPSRCQQPDDGNDDDDDDHHYLADQLVNSDVRVRDELVNSPAFVDIKVFSSGLCDNDQVIIMNQGHQSSPSSSASSSSSSDSSPFNSAFASKASSTISDTDFASDASLSAADPSSIVTSTEASDAVFQGYAEDALPEKTVDFSTPSDAVWRKFGLSMPTPPISPSRDATDLDEIVPLLEMDDGFNAFISEYLKDLKDPEDISEYLKGPIDVDVESSFDDFFSLSSTNPESFVESSSSTTHCPASSSSFSSSSSSPIASSTSFCTSSPSLSSSSNGFLSDPFDALMFDDAGLPRDRLLAASESAASSSLDFLSSAVHDPIASSSSSSPSSSCPSSLSSSKTSFYHSEAKRLQSKLISDCMWSGPNQNLLVTERLHHPLSSSLSSSSSSSSSSSMASSSSSSNRSSAGFVSPSTPTGFSGFVTPASVTPHQKQQLQQKLLRQQQQQLRRETGAAADDDDDAACVDCRQRGISGICRRNASCRAPSSIIASSPSSSSSYSSAFTPDSFFATTSSSSSSSSSLCQCSPSDLSSLDCVDPKCKTYVFPYALSASIPSSSSSSSSSSSLTSTSSSSPSTEVTFMSTEATLLSTLPGFATPGFATPSESEEEMESISVKEEVVVVTAPSSPTSPPNNNNVVTTFAAPTKVHLAYIGGNVFNAKIPSSSSSSPTSIASPSSTPPSSSTSSHSLSKSFSKKSQQQQQLQLQHTPLSPKTVQRSTSSTQSSSTTSPSTSPTTPTRGIILKGRTFRQAHQQQQQKLRQLHHQQQQSTKQVKGISLLATAEGLTELQKQNIQAAASQLMKIQRKRLLEADDIFDNNNNNSNNKNKANGIITLTTAPDHQGLCKRPRLTGSSSSSSSSLSSGVTSGGGGVKRHHVTTDELTQALFKVTQSHKNRRSGGGGRGAAAGIGCGSGLDDGMLDDRLDPVKRAQHNVLERKRRTDLKMSFQALRVEVPELRDNDKAPKVLILKRAASHIDTIREDEERLQTEMKSLKQRNKELMAHLARLKQLQRHDKQQQQPQQQQQPPPPQSHQRHQKFQQQQKQQRDLKPQNVFRVW